VCYAGVIKAIGANTTVKETVELVKKDKAFYDASGGGVTISGGEPLAQPSFLIALLDALKEENIHTVLDTSGFAEAEIFKKAAEAADMVYFDIKLMSPDDHKKWTGVSNELILLNFRTLTKMRKPYHVRFPYIPEITAATENMKLIAELINCECEVKELDILPYHRLGVKKYESLGLVNSVEQMGIQPPSKEMLMDVKAYFESEGIKANIIV
jgi:pyruvate formate lyase activating enzyme